MNTLEPTLDVLKARYLNLIEAYEEKFSKRFSTEKETVNTLYRLYSNTKVTAETVNSFALLIFQFRKEMCILENNKLLDQIYQMPTRYPVEEFSYDEQIAEANRIKARINRTSDNWNRKELLSIGIVSRDALIKVRNTMHKMYSLEMMDKLQNKYQEKIAERFLAPHGDDTSRKIKDICDSHRDYCNHLHSID